MALASTTLHHWIARMRRSVWIRGTRVWDMSKDENNGIFPQEHTELFDTVGIVTYCHTTRLFTNTVVCCSILVMGHPG